MTRRSSTRTPLRRSRRSNRVLARERDSSFGRTVHLEGKGIRGKLAGQHAHVHRYQPALSGGRISVKGAGYDSFDRNSSVFWGLGESGLD